MLDANAALLDVVGVVQHHDAITGTGRQNVSKDYIDRIWNALKKVNSVYGKVVQELAASAGLNSENWEWCAASNSSYIDCPIAYRSWEEGSKIAVAIHNPANLPMRVA